MAVVQAHQTESGGLLYESQPVYLRPQESQLLSVPGKSLEPCPLRFSLACSGYHRVGIGVDGRDLDRCPPRR